MLQLWSRSLARFRQKNYAGAIEDWTQALESGMPYIRVYFMRARARAQAGDLQGAKQDPGSFILDWSIF